MYLWLTIFTWWKDTGDTSKKTSVFHEGIRDLTICFGWKCSTPGENRPIKVISSSLTTSIRATSFHHDNTQISKGIYIYPSDPKLPLPSFCFTHTCWFCQVTSVLHYITHLLLMKAESFLVSVIKIKKLQLPVKQTGSSRGVAPGSFTRSPSFRGPTQKSGLTTAHLKPTNLPLESWLCPVQLRWLSGLAVTDSSRSSHCNQWLPSPLRSTDVVHKNSEVAACGRAHICLTINTEQVQGAPQAAVPGRNQVQNEGDPAPFQLVVVAEQGICNSLTHTLTSLRRRRAADTTLHLILVHLTVICNVSSSGAQMTLISPFS